MHSIYKHLALVLDRIPNGYPETESGVELKILARLFTPEEAELACRLNQQGVSAKNAGGAIGWDEKRTFTVLKEMRKKGLIDAEKRDGELVFKLIPFIVGFYEHQNGRIDKEFAELFETYYHEAFHRMMSVRPSVHRVVPIAKAIPSTIEVLPYERASDYIENAASWGVLNCICRVQKKLIGEDCGHTVENCLAFYSKPNAIAPGGAIRVITKEEALSILEQADREGLVHSTSNFKEGVTYICNCCSCSCGVLRGMAEYGYNEAMGKSDFYADSTEELCSGCSACVEHCTFRALSIVDGVCMVDRQRCWGCGLCISGCPSGALSLKMKEIKEPLPSNYEEWMKVRASNRNL